MTSFKKTAFVSLFMFISVIYAMTARVSAAMTPWDLDGVKAQSLWDTGVEVFYASHSATPQLVSGSSIAVLGVLTSTAGFGIETGAFVELRATNTANSSSELLVPAIQFSSTTRNTFVVYDVPPIANTGLSINLTSKTIGDAAVFYVHLATNVNFQFRIPYDSAGIKTFNPALHGVSVSSGNAGNLVNNGLGTEVFDYSTAEKLVTYSSTGVTRRTFYYGLSASTGAAGDYVVIRDTHTTGSSVGANKLLPAIFHNVTTFEDINNYSKPKNFYFPWPIAATRGLTVQAGQVGIQYRHYWRYAAE